MEFSKLKLELYDLAAIFLPGLFLITELWTMFGRTPFRFAVMKELNGLEFTIVLMCSFATGNIVQEASNWTVTRFKGKRFFKQARDEYWKLPEGEHVRTKILHESELTITSVDVAFDYCLTRIAGSFAKRDVFVAISDFARSLWLLSALAVLPLGRAVLYTYGAAQRTELTVEGLTFLGIANYLSWVRMMRFRRLSETPVFSAYLATFSGQLATPAEKAENEPKS